MKHIRLFESQLTPKYKVGDYVHLNMEPDFSYEDNLGQIIKIDKNGFLEEPGENDSDKNHDEYINSLNKYPYSVKILNGVFDAEETLIDRYLSKDEIINFEFLLKNKKDINKFNIWANYLMIYTKCCDILKLYKNTIFFLN